MYDDKSLRNPTTLGKILQTSTYQIIRETKIETSCHHGSARLIIYQTQVFSKDID